MQNLLRHGERHPLTIYVRCGQCGALVARYKLKGYYHHGKGFGSWLQRYQGISRESGRDLMGEFKEAQSSAVEEFAEVVEQLEEMGKLDPADDEGGSAV